MTVYEEFLKVPEILTAEIVDGELIVSPHLDARHNRAANKIFGRVVSRDYDDGEWWIYFRPELHLGADIFVPETAGFRRERVPEPPLDEHWNVAPDWICEVVSPSTKRLDRIRKLPRYATHGVGHAWMLDPIERGLEVYRLVEGHWSLIAVHEGDDVVRAEPFEAIELPLSALWT